MDKQIVITVKSVFAFFGIILGGYLIYRLFDTIVLLVISFLVVIALEGLVQFFPSKKLLGLKISRSLSVIMAYVILLFTIVVFSTLVFPPVFIQIQKLLLTLPEILNAIPVPKNFELSLSNILPQVTQIGDNVLNLTVSVFSNATNFITVIMFSLYVSFDLPNLKKRFIGFFPDKYKYSVESILVEVESVVGNWIKGQLILMLVIGGFSFMGLYLLDVDYPLALGLIAGVLEFIPVIGPVISAVIAAVVAFTQEPLKGLAVVVLFFIIQQLENNILVPRIMGSVSGYGPLMILFVLMVFSNFFGILGAILAIPVFMVMMIIIKRVLNFDSEKKS